MTSSIAWQKREQQIKETQSKKPSESTAELSRAERMTKARQAVNPAGLNPFERHRKPKVAPAVVATPPAAKTRFGGREDDKLRVARENEQARRAKLQEQAKRTVYPTPSAADIEAIVLCWVDRNPQYVITEWNNEMMRRAMEHFCSIGKLWWTSEALDKVFVYLRDGGYLERQNGGVRIRGEKPPREFPLPEDEAVPATRNQQIKTHTAIIPREEEQRLRSLPFDQLAAQAKAGFRKGGSR